MTLRCSISDFQTFRLHFPRNNHKFCGYLRFWLYQFYSWISHGLYSKTSRISIEVIEIAIPFIFISTQKERNMDMKFLTIYAFASSAINQCTVKAADIINLLSSAR